LCFSFIEFGIFSRETLPKTLGLPARPGGFRALLGGQQVSNPPGFPGVGPNSYYAAAGRVNRLMERLLVATYDLQL